MSNPPLTTEWERAAIKELCDVVHLLTHGMFDSPEDLRDRLHQAGDNIIQTQQLYNPLPESTRPEINAIGGRFIGE